MITCLNFHEEEEEEEEKEEEEVVEEIKTHILCSITFFRTSCRL
jgi:hypothetical protein